MKDNKGFTLVELLAVILILIGISLVAVSSISASLERRDRRECQEQIAIVKNAAKMYFSLNEDSVTIVTLEQLIAGGYLTEKSKYNRITNGSISKTSSTYQFSGSCS